jgi:hypothetical protein
VSDEYFRQVMGVPENAGREEIKRAYRRLVMENHPDRFPLQAKALQELRLITLTEAYSALMSSRAADGPPAAAPGAAGSNPNTGLHNAPGAPAPAAGLHDARSRPGDSLGPHKDPAYAYYKQGFLNFSLAIHGIAEANQKVAAQKTTGFKPYRVAQDFTNSLSLLGAAHGYFQRVVGDHPGSVWAADARVKLKRIQRFTRLYRMILSNLGGVEPEARPHPEDPQTR